MEVSLIKVASPFVGMGMGGGVWGGVRAEVIVSVGKGYLCPGGHLKTSTFGPIQLYKKKDAGLGGLAYPPCRCSPAAGPCGMCGPPARAW